jgi:hypothetical protein
MGMAAGSGSRPALPGSGLPTAGSVGMQIRRAVAGSGCGSAVVRRRGHFGIAVAREPRVLWRPGRRDGGTWLRRPQEAGDDHRVRLVTQGGNSRGSSHGAMTGTVTDRSLCCARGLRRRGKSFVPLGPMTATSMGVVSTLEAFIERPSPLCTACSSWVKTLTLWLGDGGATASCPSLEASFLEVCARSVCGGGQRRGEEDGGLADDSSLSVSTTEEDSQEEDVGAVIGGHRICLPMEGDGFVRPCASCDHKVGEEAGVGGVHEVGDEADMGGGG